MRRSLLPLLVICGPVLGGSVARADGGVGVVVTGDATTQPQLTAQLEQWLRAQGHPLVPSPLPAEVLSTLIDCLVIEDVTCARALVAKASTAPQVVFARVDTASEAAGPRDLTLTIHWFDRAGAPVEERRTCERCTTEALRATATAMMETLATRGAKAVGTMQLTSIPSGARVTVDGAEVGTTPLTYAVRPGPHEVTLRHGARTDTRTITIVQAATVAVDVTLAAPAAAGSARARLPLYVVGGGGALVLGGVLAYATSQVDDGTRYEYRDTRPLGVGLALAGLAAIGVGTYLHLRPGHRESAPAVALVPGGAAVGWAGSF